MKFFRSILAIAYSNFWAVDADLQYISRPDLSPPRLNITVKANSTDKGYLFIAPYAAHEGEAKGPSQPGAYIFKDNGDLIWSGVGHFGGWVAHFRTGILNDQPVIFAFQGQFDVPHGRAYGNHAILNNQYETVEVLKPAGPLGLLSAHEFHLVNGKTVLVEVPVPVQADLEPWGGAKGQQWIVSGGIQEIDIETGELIFEWHSLDHVERINPKYSQFALQDGPELSGKSNIDAWNYFHINSIDKNSQGEYLISARNYAAIFKISQKGEIVWQLGGKHGSTFSFDGDVQFAFQHDARFVWTSSDGNIEIISFFDNAAHSTGKRINKFSRARIVRLNHIDKTATAIRTFPAPDGLSAHSQGNTQLLPNGNVFVNWGQAGAVTEFDSKSAQVLFHAYLDSEPEGKLVQSYRGFRLNWTGFPADPPAIAVVKTDDEISIYVSWNGDTETELWRFYQEGDSHKPLGVSRRTSFETKFTLSGDGVDKIYAEAIDSFGNALVRTRLVSVLSSVRRLNKGIVSVAALGESQITIGGQEL